MALIYNATFDSQTRILSLLDKAGNVISSCEVPSKELVDDPKKPLMLRAIEDNSSVTLKKNGTLSNTYQTSTNGTDWTNYTLGTKISLNNGESVYFRCSNHPTTQTGSNYVQFVMKGKIEAWHNVLSLYHTNDFATYESVAEYAFCNLFKSCRPLIKAPVLPATTLANHCYDSMFSGCQSLTEAPELPATKLANSCYSYMFESCQSLTKAPALPAKYLAFSCYYVMFARCQSLKEVRIAAISTGTYALDYWLSGVSATGDFYCNPSATIFPTGTSGIPNGWTRRNIAYYPN